MSHKRAPSNQNITHNKRTHIFHRYFWGTAAKIQNTDGFIVLVDSNRPGWYCILYDIVLLGQLSDCLLTQQGQCWTPAPRQRNHHAQMSIPLSLSRPLEPDGQSGPGWNGDEKDREKEIKRKKKRERQCLSIMVKSFHNYLLSKEQENLTPNIIITLKCKSELGDLTDCN